MARGNSGRSPLFHKFLTILPLSGDPPKDRAVSGPFRLFHTFPHLYYGYYNKLNI